MSHGKKGVKRASLLVCRSKEGPTGEGVLSELHTGTMSQSVARKQGMVFLPEGIAYLEMLRQKRSQCDKRHQGSQSDKIERRS